MPNKAFTIVRAAALAAAALFVARDVAAQELSASAAHGRRITHPTVITRPGSCVVARNFSVEGPGRGHRRRRHRRQPRSGRAHPHGPRRQAGRGSPHRRRQRRPCIHGVLNRFGTGVEVRHASYVRIEGLHIHGEDGGGPPPGEVGVLIVNCGGSSSSGT